MESVIRRKSFEFALTIIELYKELQKNREYVISRQLLRSGTSIGANVEEATEPQGFSVKDGYCLKRSSGNEVLAVVTSAIKTG